MNTNQKPQDPKDPPKQPVKLKGVQLIEMKWVKLEDINFETFRKDNDARVGDIDHSKVEEFVELKRSNDFNSFAFAPPTLDENMNVVNGHHRIQASLIENEIWVWVAIQKFDSIRIRKRYQTIDNKTKKVFVSNPRTKEEILNAVKSDLSYEFDIDNPPEEIDVKRTIKELQIETSEYKHKNLIIDVLKDFNVRENIKTYSKTEADQYVEKHYSNEVDTLYTECIKFESEKHTFRDDREFMFRMLKHKISFNCPDELTMLFAHFVNIKDIDKVRKQKLSSLQKFEKFIKDAYNIITDSNYKSTKVVFLPQKKDEL